MIVINDDDVVLHALDSPQMQLTPLLPPISRLPMKHGRRSAHADGSCDDYYPFERALGAAVFSLQAQVEAYRLLDLDDEDLLRFFERRAEWIAGHGETGRLTNHHALAALALWRTAALVGRSDLAAAAVDRARDVVASQHAEGWYPEYDGADPGYQSLCTGHLADVHRRRPDWGLAEPLARSVRFAWHFAHPASAPKNTFCPRSQLPPFNSGTSRATGTFAGAFAVGAQGSSSRCSGSARGRGSSCVW